jgi:hypothetical protein
MACSMADHYVYMNTGPIIPEQGQLDIGMLFLTLNMNEAWLTWHITVYSSATEHVRSTSVYGLNGKCLIVKFLNQVLYIHIKLPHLKLIYFLLVILQNKYIIMFAITANNAWSIHFIISFVFSLCRMNCKEYKGKILSMISLVLFFLKHLELYISLRIYELQRIQVSAQVQPKQPLLELPHKSYLTHKHACLSFQNLTVKVQVKLSLA